DNKKVFKRDEKSDIYSLGMLLWELTSGVPPSYQTLNNLSKTTDNFKMQNKIDKLSNLSAKLSKIYIDLTNNGSEFIQISKLIKEIIVKHQETPQRMFEYLCENQDNDLDSCILGFFYLEGIGTSEDYKDAFNMFEKTANQISIAKFYLGECFRCGYGTEKNLKSAITWYEKAEADGHARSINALGLSFDYFNKSYEMGYIPSCNNLGNCYEFGRGTKTNKEKAFKYYLKAATQNFSSSKYNVAECYKNGIGIEKNLDEAE
ncbi:hypothetical protein C2G38_2053038, partial [Gigaspora rosea]